MTSMLERYDRDAARYVRWWAPVLAPTALRLIDLVERLVPCEPAHVLDIGAGTGVLTIGTAERWPGAEVTAVDGSAGMLGLARAEAERRLGSDRLRRVSFLVGRAESLPLADGTFDLAVSSFVFQLVTDRRAAFQESHRVLQPGGWLAFVTWQVDASPFAPDRVFDDALDEIGYDEPEWDDEARGGDFASPGAAAAQLRRAGFRRVHARTEWLEHRYDPASFLAFLEQFDEHVLFESLEPKRRDRLRDLTAAGLGRLGPDDFLWRRPVVIVRAQRPS